MFFSSVPKNIYVIETYIILDITVANKNSINSDVDIICKSPFSYNMFKIYNKILNIIL